MGLLHQSSVRTLYREQNTFAGKLFKNCMFHKQYINNEGLLPKEHDKTSSDEPNSIAVTTDTKTLFTDSCNEAGIFNWINSTQLYLLRLNKPTGNELSVDWVFTILWKIMLTIDEE